MDGASRCDGAQASDSSASACARAVSHGRSSPVLCLTVVPPSSADCVRMSCSTRRASCERRSSRNTCSRSRSDRLTDRQRNHDDDTRVTREAKPSRSPLLRHCLTAPMLPCPSCVLSAGVRSSVFFEAHRRPLPDGDGCGCGRGPSARLQVQDAAQFVAAQVRLLRDTANRVAPAAPTPALQQAIHCFVQQTIVHRAQRSPVPPRRFLQAHNFIRFKCSPTF